MLDPWTRLTAVDARAADASVFALHTVRAGSHQPSLATCKELPLHARATYLNSDQGHVLLCSIPIHTQPAAAWQIGQPIFERAAAMHLTGHTPGKAGWSNGPALQHGLLNQ